MFQATPIGVTVYPRRHRAQLVGQRLGECLGGRFGLWPGLAEAPRAVGVAPAHRHAKLQLHGGAVGGGESDQRRGPKRRAAQAAPQRRGVGGQAIPGGGSLLEALLGGQAIHTLGQTGAHHPMLTGERPRCGANDG